MKKLILILLSTVLLAAGCVYYPYADSSAYYDTDSGYTNTYPYYPYYYTYPYYYYPYYYPWGYRYHYGPRRWR